LGDQTTGSPINIKPPGFKKSEDAFPGVFYILASESLSAGVAEIKGGLPFIGYVSKLPWRSKAKI
jgi:hypothetical protein